MLKTETLTAMNNLIKKTEKTFNIYKGTYKCSDWNLIASYYSKRHFISKIKKLGYETATNSKLSDETTCFKKTFNDYTISII